MVDDYPPGFRFYPTEEELVSFYLHNKLAGHRQDLNLLMDRIIPVINIYDYNPWDLPRKYVSPLNILIFSNFFFAFLFFVFDAFSSNGFLKKWLASNDQMYYIA